MLTCTPTISTPPHFLISSSSYPSCLFVLLFYFIVLLYLMGCVNLHPTINMLPHKFPISSSYPYALFCCLFLLLFCFIILLYLMGYINLHLHHKHTSPLPNLINVLYLRAALLLLVSCVVVIVLYLMECLNKKKNPPYSPIPNPITVSVHFSYVCEAEGMFRGLCC